MKNGANAARAKSAMARVVFPPRRWPATTGGNGAGNRKGDPGLAPAGRIVISAVEGMVKIANATDHADLVASEIHSGDQADTKKLPISLAKDMKIRPSG